LIIDQAFKPMAKKAGWIESPYYLILSVGVGSYMPFLLNFSGKRSWDHLSLPPVPWVWPRPSIEKTNNLKRSLL